MSGILVLCVGGLASSGQSCRNLLSFTSRPSLGTCAFGSIDAVTGTVMSQGKGNRLLVCQDAWADQGDESELHFVADVVLKITVFVFHIRCWFVWFGSLVGKLIPHQSGAIVTASTVITVSTVTPICCTYRG